VIEIQTVTLETILDRNLPIGQEISFMSIDAEGHDLNVLRSNNWNKYRPELVLAEDHQNSLTAIMYSKITQYMAEVNYSVYAWIRPSIVYINNDIGNRGYHT
jgi:hypothetical protein